MNFLADKVAIITGAGRERGMGQAAAIKLAAQGAKIVVTDLVRSDDERAALDNVAATIKELGGETLAMAVDVTDRQQIDQCVEQTCQHFGGVDILFNNAGTAIGEHPFLELKDLHWDLSYQVNLKAIADFSQAVIPVMQAHGGGAIINNSSLAGLGAVAGMAAYVATKFAVVGLTKAIAREFGQDNIRCNAVCPGMIDTQLSEQAVDWYTGLHPELSREQARQELAEDVSLKRWAQPEEVGDAVAYLAGPHASYISGVALPVDGGLPVGL